MFFAPNHYLNECQIIINQDIENKLQWNFIETSNIFIQESVVENVVCTMAAIIVSIELCLRGNTMVAPGTYV